MKPLFLACALMTLPTMIGACTVGPDIFREYTRAQTLSLETPIRIVRGRFEAGPGAPVPRAEGMQERVGLLIGQELGPEGFDQAFEAEILWVEPAEGRSWFDHPLPDLPAVAFLATTKDGLMLTTGYCGGGYILTTEADIRALEECSRAGDCTGN